MKYVVKKCIIFPASALFITVAVTGSSCDPCTGIDANNTAAIVQCVRSQPKENILAIPEVKEYLSKHQVYLSLTTSPQRIAKILPVLQTLDLELVANVFLVLPKQFSRDNSTYVIPSEIEKFDKKLQILRIEKDLGPITKLFPAVVYVNNSEENQKAAIKFVLDTPQPPKPDPNSIVITIDDDSAYHYGTISQLIKYVILQDSVVGGIGTNLDYYGIKRTDWPEITEPQPKCGSTDASGCDLIEGWGAIAYKAGHGDVGLMKKLSELGKDKGNRACFASDDLVLSYALAAHKPNPISKFMIRNDYIQKPVQFSFGFEEDALHRGAGDGSQSTYAHAQKYPLCLNEVKKNENKI